MATTVTEAEVDEQRLMEEPELIEWRSRRTRHDEQVYQDRERVLDGLADLCGPKGDTLLAELEQLWDDDVSNAYDRAKLMAGTLMLLNSQRALWLALVTLELEASGSEPVGVDRFTAATEDLRQLTARARRGDL